MNSVLDENSAQMKHSQNTMEGSQYDPAEGLKVGAGGDSYRDNTTAQQLMVEMQQLNYNPKYCGINPLAIQNEEELAELAEAENWEENYPLAPFPKETLKLS